MKGVISLLDSRHSDLVGELWDRLNREFGLSGVYETPFPHILYHTAQDYDYGSLELVLRRISRTTVPFTVRTSGLGILMEGRKFSWRWCAGLSCSGFINGSFSRSRQPP